MPQPLACFVAQLAALLALVDLPSAQRENTTEVPIVNLGLASGSRSAIRLTEELLVFPVSEGQQGATDRNGDGDATDLVAYVYDRRNDRGFNTGLAVARVDVWCVAEGGRVAFLVDEAAQGADLDGDGDLDDWVVHVLELGRGRGSERYAVTNLGAAVRPSVGGFGEAQPGEGLFLAAWAGPRFVFRAFESTQSADLNEDGDRVDVVLRVYDTRVGAFVGAPLALDTEDDPWVLLRSMFSYDEFTVAFVVSEAAEGGRDRNEDGDADDFVHHTLELASGRITNLGFAAGDAMGPASIHGRLLAFPVSEAAQGGRDLNGDGDALDQVLHTTDLRRGRTTNRGLALTPFSAGRFYESTELLVLAVRLDEAGQDLNGDGDGEDGVLHLIDLRRDRIENLGLAGYTTFLSSGFLGIEVNELEQGGHDLNGDGDALDWGVLHLYDPASGALTNLGVTDVYYGGVFGSSIASGSRLVVQVIETFQGADLNDDRDEFDLVPRIVDLATGTVIEPRLAQPHSLNNFSGPQHLVGDRLLLVVSETAQGFTDLDGNGETNDDLVYLIDASSGAARWIGLTVDTLGKNSLYAMPRAGSWVACAAVEDTDLNGDGDTGDWVVQLIDLR